MVSVIFVPVANWQCAALVPIILYHPHKYMYIKGKLESDDLVSIEEQRDL